MVKLEEIKKFEDIPFDKVTYNDFRNCDRQDLIELVIKFGKLYQESLKLLNESHENFEELHELYKKGRYN